MLLKKNAERIGKQYISRLIKSNADNKNEGNAKKMNTLGKPMAIIMSETYNQEMSWSFERVKYRIISKE